MHPGGTHRIQRKDELGSEFDFFESRAPGTVYEQAMWALNLHFRRASLPVGRVAGLPLRLTRRIHRGRSDFFAARGCKV